MIHLNRLAFGSMVMLILFVAFIVGWGLFGVLLRIMAWGIATNDHHITIPIGVIIFVLLAYCIGSARDKENNNDT